MSTLQNLLLALAMLPWSATSMGTILPRYSNTTSSILPGWFLAGCDSSPLSTWTLNTTNALMTIDMCLSACQGTGSLVAGIQETNCYCNGPPLNPVPEGECNAPCPGASNSTCGGSSSFPLPGKRAPGPEMNITDSYYTFTPLSNNTNSTGADGTNGGDPIQSDLAGASTSTIYTTVLQTITSCAAAVTDCPSRNGTAGWESVVTTTSPVSQIIFKPQTTALTPCDNCEVTTTTTLLAYTTIPCPAATGKGQNNAGAALTPPGGNVSLSAGGKTLMPSASASGKAGGPVTSAAGGRRQLGIWGGVIGLVGLWCFGAVVGLFLV